MKLLLSTLISISMLGATLVSFHSFSIEGLNKSGKINMKDFAGKKVLIVNVASKCGYTSQYEDLQKLSDKYKEQLVVIGVPCNQFMGQEPGTEEEIVRFCSSTYGVLFPMTTKIDVKGKDQHPLYTWLTNKTENGVGDFTVSWNFNKFLVNEKGELVAHFGSGVKPLSSEITDYLK